MNEEQTENTEEQKINNSEGYYKYITETITDDMQNAYTEFMKSIKMINFELTSKQQPEIVEQCRELEMKLFLILYPINGINPLDVCILKPELKKEYLIQISAMMETRKKLLSGEMSKDEFLKKTENYHG